MSADGLHDNEICEDDIAVAARFFGIDGACISEIIELLDDELILEELLERDDKALDIDELELLKIADELLELLCIVIALDELLDIELDNRTLDINELL